MQDVVPGRTRYLKRGGIETAINVGRRRYREILIELKYGDVRWPRGNAGSSVRRRAAP